MEPVYGRKRNAGQTETWMDRFTQLEPEGGFRAAVHQAWNHSGVPSDKTAQLSALYGSINGNAVGEMKAAPAKVGAAS
jgi:hypothetical protein